MGRPKIPSEHHRTPININVTDAELAALDGQAARFGLTRPALIRLMLAALVRQSEAAPATGPAVVAKEVDHDGEGGS